MSKDDDKGINISNVNQSGGVNIQIGSGSINVAVQPGWRNITSRPQDVAMVNAMLNAHPGMNVAFITPMGDAEAMSYATQIRDLLTSNGFPVEQFISEGAGWQPMPPPLACRLEGDTLRIIVGNQNSPTRPTASPN